VESFGAIRIWIILGEQDDELESFPLALWVSGLGFGAGLRFRFDFIHDFWVLIGMDW